MTNTNTAPVYTADNLTNDDISAAFRTSLVDERTAHDALFSLGDGRAQVAAALNASLPAGTSRKTSVGFEP